MKMKGRKNKHMNIENEQEFIQGAFFELLNKGWIKRGFEAITYNKTRY